MEEPDRLVVALVPGPIRLDDGSAAVDDPAFERLAKLAREHGEALRWVVIDDIDDETCELAISPWPQLTPDGRLRFARDEAQHMVGDVDSATLLRLVRAARRERYGRTAAAREIVDRPLRVGDTFAAILACDAPPDDAPAGGERTVVRFPHGAKGIADVTTDARRFAKIQSALANAAPLERKQVVPRGDAGPT
jgi:hypothetical protein